MLYQVGFKQDKGEDRQSANDNIAFLRTLSLNHCQEHTTIRLKRDSLQATNPLKTTSFVASHIDHVIANLIIYTLFSSSLFQKKKPFHVVRSDSKAPRVVFHKLQARQ